jgi:hypothetical protein
MKPRDTDDAAYQAQIAALRALGMEGRLQRGIELSENVRALTEAGIRQRQPELTEAQVRYELLRILYGQDLADRVAAQVAK